MSDVFPTPGCFRLTELAHGGGCGCKLAPAVLQQLLAGQTAALFPQLLVGTKTSDDATVWQLSDDQCVIATTDFFMPIVDDPHDFGRIAATNAISDIYAMGGTPILALAILGIRSASSRSRSPATSWQAGRLPAPARVFRSPAAIRSTPPSRSTASR